MPTRDYKEESVTIEKLKDELKDDNKVKVAGIDINGVLRGKVISKEKFLSSVKHNSFGFCSVIFGWDLHDQNYFQPSKYSSTENGYSDLLAKIDITSFRRIPWEDDIPFFLVDFFIEEGKILPVCPRNVLKQVISNLNSLGFNPYCGVEYEWFNYDETPQSLSEHPSTPKFLTPGYFGYSLLRTNLKNDYFNDIFDQCKKIDIDIEGLHTETGPGVYEAALAYCPALKMADNAVLFKTAVKQIGLKHNIMASFMAKPKSDLPGCSGHIHLSLKDLQDTNNMFSDEGKNTSKTLDHFIAGLVLALPSIMPFLAPTINSYKRLNENYWAPVRVAWGYDNRLASIRVIAPPTCSKEATRIEIRVSGSDINASLAIAAILASGSYAIKNKLANPLPPLKEGQSLNDYPGEKLPKSLKEAHELMNAKDSFARKALGDDLIDHYSLVCRHEIDLFEGAVTDWETKRYFELI
ncbi:putative glutamine synthetase [Neoconidiobolus thromboides FSU 785]|nr:putative glutamine synthetase [Neoconidiobolus thromboides FSU 785]